MNEWQPINTVPTDQDGIDLWVKSPTVKQGGYRITDCVYRENKWWQPVEYDYDDEEANQRWFGDLTGYWDTVETSIIQATHWMKVGQP